MREPTDQLPRRRETTIGEILDAAERLFAGRGFTDVTVRDIAAAAGVSHALVHRYLGTKEEIFRAVLARNEDAFLRAAPAGDDLLESASLMLRQGLAHGRDYLRLVLLSAMQGVPQERPDVRSPATERLVQLAQAAAAEAPDEAGLDPRFVVAACLALLLGWNAAADILLRSVGFADMDQGDRSAALERLLLDILREQLPGARYTEGLAG